MRLRAIAAYSKNDRAEFVKTVQEAQAEQQTTDITKKKKRLAAAQKRAGELEKLMCKVYEDNALDAIRAEDIANGVFIPVNSLPRQAPQKATLPASVAV